MLLVIRLRVWPIPPLLGEKAGMREDVKTGFATNRLAIP